MTDDPDARSRDDRDGAVPTDRESPVGAPVIRGDESVTGQRAREAVQFDPDDPESVANAAEIVYQFATGDAEGDNLVMLRGAAACAALVRGVGSYKTATEQANAVGDDDSTVTVSFIRKWARVHDLPRSVRRQVALGAIAPTAAKHIARVSGEARLLLAWATLDGDLTVREVRAAASAINDGVPIDEALADHGVVLGRLELTLPRTTYRDLRRQASLEGVTPGDVVADAFEQYLE